MNKPILLLLPLVLSSAVLAQTDSSLQNKYWSYRDEFKKHFVKVGPQDGESLPFDAITFKMNCGGFSGHRMDAGDIMATWGDYVAVLATEYKLLKSVPGNEHEIKGLLNEIYYAIRAYERLDGYAEVYYGGLSEPRDTNSFFVRDDIPLELYTKWPKVDSITFQAAHRTAGIVFDTIVIESQDIWEDSIAGVKHRMAGYPYFCKKTSDQNYQGYPYNGVVTYAPWTKNEDTDLRCTDIITDTTTRVNDTTHIDDWKPINEMSQDHMLGVLMGCFYIHKYIEDDIFIQPTSADEGFYIRTKTEQITDDIMTMLTTKMYDTTLHFEIKDEGEIIGTYDIDFDSTNYIIVNPITGLPVSRGWEAFFFSKAFSDLGEAITGTNYPAASVAPDGIELHTEVENITDFKFASNLGAFFGIDDLNVHFFGINPKDTLAWNFIWNKLPQIYFYSLDPTPVPIEVLGIPIVKVSPPARSISDWDVGMNMIMRLGAMTGSWTHELFDSMADEQNFPWFELMYAVLNEQTPKNSQSYYAELLDYASCTGSQKSTVLDTNRTTFFVILNDTTFIDIVYEHAPFNRSSAFSMPNRTNKNILGAEFNGLDFMLLHNLYRLGFEDSLTDQTDPDFCPCTESALSNYGATTGSAVKVTDSTLARFPEYLNYSMSVPEFVSHDVWVTTGNGNLQVKGDLTICNAKMSVFTNAKLQVTASATGTKKTLKVGRGATLDLRHNSTLQLDSFTRLYIAPEGKLIVDNNSTIIVDKNASVEIAGELELDEGDVFEIDTGANGRGFVRFVKQNHDEGAHITINDAIGPSSVTVFNFIGDNDQDKALEIDGQFGMFFPDSVEVNIRDCKVEMGENSSLYLEGEVTYLNVDIVPKDTSKPFKNGIAIAGQDSVDIHKVDISGGHRGIQALNYLGGNNYPQIHDITIEDCEQALAYEGGGLNIDTATFKNNTLGIISFGVNLSSEIKEFTFDNNDNSINDFGTGLGFTKVRFGIIKNSDIGHVAEGNVIRPLCVDYEDNTDAYYFTGKPVRLSINGNEDAGVNSYIGNSKVTNGEVHSFTMDFHNGLSKFNNNTDLFTGVFHPSQAIIEDGTTSPTSYKWYTSSNLWDNALSSHWYDLTYYYGMGIHFEKTVDIAPVIQINQTQYTDSKNGACPDHIGSGFLVGYDEGEQNIDLDNQVIITSSFVDAPLSDVFETINTKLYDEKDYDSTFILSKEILLHNTWVPYSKFDEYVLNRIYYQFLEAYGHIYSDDETTNLASITAQAYEVLDTLIDRDTDSVWSDITYEIQIDKSDIYRLNGDYDDAIDILEDLDSIDPDSTLSTFIDKLLCLNRSERDVINGTYSRFEIDTVYDCGIDSVIQSGSSSMVAFASTKNPEYTDEPRLSGLVIGDSTKTNHKAKHKPQELYRVINSSGFSYGQGDVVIRFKNKLNYQYEVLNIDGRVLYSGTEFRTNSFRLSPMLLDRGVYLIKIHKLKDSKNIVESPYVIERVVRYNNH